MAGEYPIIEEALDEILEELRVQPISPRVRELRAQAGMYQRVVRQWAFARPTPAQAAAMLECVMELHVKVRGRVTARPPPSWSPAKAAIPSSTPPPPKSTKRDPSR